MVMSASATSGASEPTRGFWAGVCAAKDFVRAQVVAAAAAYESGRVQIVDAARAKLPQKLAYLIDRISKVVPEILVGVAVVSGRPFFALPALAIELYRKRELIKPLFVSGDFGPLNQFFNSAIVPAMLVCFAATAVFGLGSLLAGHHIVKFISSELIGLSGVALSAQTLLEQRRSTLTPLPDRGGSTGHQDTTATPLKASGQQ